MAHDCVTLTYTPTSEITETPIDIAELELYVDGSAQVIEETTISTLLVPSSFYGTHADPQTDTVKTPDDSIRRYNLVLEKIKKDHISKAEAYARLGIKALKVHGICTEFLLSSFQA
ncbi:coiled-coil domain-containing protein 106-like [Labeo rohita]|uniref:Coiled-coil domain-containing protein 106-like n=1 Tax=Labeo rohita TaxID=84645 RepID=A0A498LSN7_LABRO|nr:coiled-coil domain-containing protein 106-like [Labeo rohita]